MNSVAASTSMIDQKTDASEKARRIEDSISSVITNVLAPSATSSLPSNEFARGLSAAGFNIAPISANAGGALTNKFSTSVIPKHKSLASSLPSLTGVVVNSPSLSGLSSPPAPLNICRPSASTTTTTSTRSSRHLQLVGDLPENVLETSCTPPSSPSKSASGQHQISVAAPIFASLTPVNVGTDSGQVTTTECFTNIRGLMSPPGIEDSSHRVTAINSSTLGANFSSNTTVATALTQLFPMVTASAASAVSPAYLAVKVEPQDTTFNSTNTGCNDGSVSSTTLLSPLQFSLSSGAVTSPTLTTLAAVTGTSAVAPNSGSLSSLATNSEFLSLQPAAVYVQPIQQNGQVQYVRLELPAAISLPSNGSGTAGNGSGKTQSAVSTVELAHSIIATMFQQPSASSSGNIQLFESSGSLQPAVVENIREGDEKTAVTMTPTFILTERPESKSNVGMTAFKVTTEPRSAGGGGGGHVQQRIIPAGITVTTTATATMPDRPAPVQPPAPVASRKRVSSSSASQSRQRQSLSQSKDAPSSIGNAGSGSGEDEGDDIYIDTKELCNRIAYELKAHSIPQAVFAERVLCRSQGTLSDLLRNPKPWNKLKSGRETFRRMYSWLKQPLVERLASLEMWKGGKRTSSGGDEPGNPAEGVDAAAIAESSGNESPEEISSEDVCYSGGSALISPRPDDPVTSTSNVQSLSTGAVNEQSSPQRHQQRVIKKPRLVFTDIQKRTLQAIFKETQRPSREMQQTIAEHLNLDLSTVQNFFMNARRRSRIEQPDGGSDSPTPFQQIRPITPPPVGSVTPLDPSNIDPNNGRSQPSNSVAPSTTTGFGKPKPKRPRRRSAKQKQAGSTDAHPPFGSLISTANDPSMNRLAFSGSTTSPAPGILNLPALALRTDEDSINGGDDIECMMLEEENGEGDEEYVEEDEDVGHSPDVVNVLDYKGLVNSDKAPGQIDPVTSAQTATGVEVKTERL